MTQYLKYMVFEEIEMEEQDPSWCAKRVDVVSMLDTNGNPFPPLPPDPDPDPE